MKATSQLVGCTHRSRLHQIRRCSHAVHHNAKRRRCNCHLYSGIVLVHRTCVGVHKKTFFVVSRLCVDEWTRTLPSLKTSDGTHASLVQFASSLLSPQSSSPSQTHRSWMHRPLSHSCIPVEQVCRVSAIIQTFMCKRQPAISKSEEEVGSVVLKFERTPTYRNLRPTHPCSLETHRRRT